MIKIVDKLPSSGNKGTYYLKQGEYWSWEDDDWVLQSSWMAKYDANIDKWKYIGLINITGQDKKYEPYTGQNLSQDLKGNWYILGDNAEIKIKLITNFDVDSNGYLTIEYTYLHMPLVGRVSSVELDISRPYLNLFKINYSKYEKDVDTLARFMIMDTPKFKYANNILTVNNAVVEQKVLGLGQDVAHTIVVSKFPTTTDDGKRIEYIPQFVKFIVDIQMRPNKTYYVKFNDGSSKLVKAEAERDLAWKYAWS